MTLDYAICPHCGCHCDDDEFCAACGKLFHDDPIPSRDVSVLGALGSGLRNMATHLEKPQNIQDIGEGGSINPLLGSSWRLHRNK